MLVLIRILKILILNILIATHLYIKTQYSDNEKYFFKLNFLEKSEQEYVKIFSIPKHIFDFLNQLISSNNDIDLFSNLKHKQSKFLEFLSDLYQFDKKSNYKKIFTFYTMGYIARV